MKGFWNYVLYPALIRFICAGLAGVVLVLLASFLPLFFAFLAVVVGTYGPVIYVLVTFIRDLSFWWSKVRGIPQPPTGGYVPR